MKPEKSGLEANFAEYKPPMDPGEALHEANRCLFCYDAPCIRACPTSIDVPAFIKKITTGNLRGSARTILEANILGASCARICPTQVLCEGACVLNDHHKEPIDIGRLQRYSTDHVVFGGGQIFTTAPANGKRVALVGGGPASLGAAAELAQLGYECVVFEKADQPGGLNSFGIADYKLTYPVAIAEIDWVKQLGIEIRCGVEVGKDISVDQLRADYDAVFLGIGLGPVGALGLPGEANGGTRDALEFIAELKTRPKAECSLEGKTVAVIGGGNTAIDAVTQSARLGANRVYMVYRRDRASMGAYAHEQKLALSDGVVFVTNTAPVGVAWDGEAVVGLQCKSTRVVDGRVEMIDGSDHTIDADVVLRATGQSKYVEFLGSIEGLELARNGRVIVDDDGRTSVEGIWSGGDGANGGKEVVNAVAEGKRAAGSMHATISGGN